MAQVADRAAARPQTIETLSGVEGRRGYEGPTWNTSSAPPVRPRRMTSPGLRSRSVVTASPLMKVPKRECLSRSR